MIRKPDSPEQTVYLSFRDWAVVMGFLLVHGAAMVGAAWKYTNSIESRMTRTEVTQQVLIQNQTKLIDITKTLDSTAPEDLLEEVEEVRRELSALMLSVERMDAEGTRRFREFKGLRQ